MGVSVDIRDGPGHYELSTLESNPITFSDDIERMEMPKHFN